MVVEKRVPHEERTKLTIEDGSVIKIFAKLLSVHGGTGNEQPKLGTKPRDIL